LIDREISKHLWEFHNLSGPKQLVQQRGIRVDGDE
jgi:hypothetical protein